jgi:hypothetical protein
MIDKDLVKKTSHVRVGFGAMKKENRFDLSARDFWTSLGLRVTALGNFSTRRWWNLELREIDRDVLQATGLARWAKLHS